ncbi:MAG: hypothetical protein AAGG72_08125, partial [Pseudomonadota bacterium]
AVSYVAACVLVTATMVRDMAWNWLRGSFALHAVAMVVLIVGTSTAGLLALPGVRDPFARVLGWQGVAQATAAELAKAEQAGQPYRAIAADGRALSASLLYYLRDIDVPIYAFGPIGNRAPKDHFQLTRPISGTTLSPVLFVSLGGQRKVFTRFGQSAYLGTQKLPAGSTMSRSLTFQRLDRHQTDTPQ